MTEKPIITGIDHPVIAVRDMAAARDTYQRLGFTIPPCGSHLEWGTGNWCIMFADDYLELRGITDPQKYTHGLDRFLANREGLMGVAFGTRDAQASYDELVRRGLKPQPVRQLTRNFELPDGTVQPRFSLCFPNETDTPGLMSVVLCQHLTPGLLRRSEWLRHANGARGVRAMTGVVRDPAAAETTLKRFFGNEHVAQSAHSITMDVSKSQIIRLLTLATFREAFPGVELAADEKPGQLCSVTLDVENLAATADYFAAHHIEHNQCANGTLRVSPKEACGVVLDFAESS